MNTVEWDSTQSANSSQTPQLEELPGRVQLRPTYQRKLTDPQNRVNDGYLKLLDFVALFHEIEVINNHYLIAC